MIADARIPEQAADALFSIMDRLNGMGVTVVESFMSDIAHWDDATATMRVRVDAPVGRRIRALFDLWMMLVFGTEYAAGALPCTPRLRLVTVPS